MVKLINPATQLYCIFGKPVGHSMSPLIHNMLFNEFGINAVYLAFEINDIKNGIDAIRTLDIKGVSITIPFKESLLEHLDEVDETAMQIGAINTVINRNGHLWGCNTDCAGATEPLKEAAGSLAGKHVCIIGAGGAAKAVAFGIKKEGGHITIVNRSREKGEHLATQVNGRFLSLSSFNDIEFNNLKHLSTNINMPNTTNTAISPIIDIIINTTSVGMTPNIDDSPVNATLFHKNMTVMDIVYNPLKTKFLKDAELAGCKTIDGLAMFIHQGAAQFELFTGLKPPHQLMRSTVVDFLKSR